MKIILIVLILIFIPALSSAASLGSSLSGEILLDVERNGEAWYVFPEDNKRYYLGRPHDAFAIMRELGLGITEWDFQRLAKAGMSVDGDIELARRLSGRIVLQIEQNGEAWYIYPKDLKAYYLGRPKDAFRIMRELSLGISRENLAKVHKPGATESINNYSNYEHKTIDTKKGSFVVDIITVDLKNPNLKIITDAVKPYPVKDVNKAFGAQPLGSFALDNNAFAGINGTYFDSYSSKKNYYFFPVYDTNTGELVNEGELKYWTTGPIMAFDANNKFYYFKDSREFPYQGFKIGNSESVATAFKKTYGVELQAAIGNKPRLIEDGLNYLIEWDIDDKQKNTKSLRNAIAYKDNKIYLVIARNATVPELADIMQAMAVEYALNLDGGYSSALWYNDEYMVLPGRDVPNAIVFSEE